MPAKKPSPPKKRMFAVSGMTCRNCELLLERTLGAVAGVANVRARLGAEEVDVTTKGAALPTLATLNTALADTPYQLSIATALTPTKESSAFRWLEIALTLAVLLVVSSLVRKAGFVSSIGTTEGAVGFLSIFLIGVAAASSSCLALVGGLLLTVSAKWVQSHPNVHGWQKLRPLLLFNAGRVAGYFVLGGIVGLAGKAFGLSLFLTGILTVTLAIVMVVFGLNILGILPKRYCSIPLPRALMRRIQGLSSSRNPLMPLVLGTLTFFIPCGFTQSMQILAFGSGSFLGGALIMLVFALGTLPALLGISIIASTVRGALARWFLIVAGSATLLLGINNLQSGFVLLGFDPLDAISHSFGNAQAELVPHDSFVTVDAQGRQVVSMYVTDGSYQPSNFTVTGNKPTWIYAIAEHALSGCASQMTVPSRNIQSVIKQGGNWLGPFTPKKGETITVACSMGMLTAHVRAI